MSENTIESVKKGNDRKGNKTYLLQFTDKHNNTVMVEFYLHEVVLQENLQDESFKTDTKADSHRGDIAKLMQKIFISKENASKIVDANGEPKVVYHQTNHTVYINNETGQNWDE